MSMLHVAFLPFFSLAAAALLPGLYAAKGIKSGSLFTFRA